MKLIVGNYKHALSKEEALVLVKELVHLQPTTYNLPTVQIVICPSGEAIADVAKMIAGTEILLGAQDVGDAIPECRYVIVGHSDRRKEGDTEEIVRRKFADVLAKGMIPILCVEGPEQVIATEGQAVYAYEPQWAVGSDRSATVEQAEAAIALLRAVAPGAKMLYGGSVDETNTAGFLSSPAIDGVLVGRASLDVERFSAIIGVV